MMVIRAGCFGPHAVWGDKHAQIEEVWSAGGPDSFSPFDTGLVKIALRLVDTVYLDNSANAVSSDL
jgi:hypothetical protein